MLPINGTCKHDFVTKELDYDEYGIISENLAARALNPRIIQHIDPDIKPYEEFHLEHFKGADPLLVAMLIAKAYDPTFTNYRSLVVATEDHSLFSFFRNWVYGDMMQYGHAVPSYALINLVTNPEVMSRHFRDCDLKTYKDVGQNSFPSLAPQYIGVFAKPVIGLHRELTGRIAIIDTDYHCYTAPTDQLFEWMYASADAAKQFVIDNIEKYPTDVNDLHLWG